MGPLSGRLGAATLVAIALVALLASGCGGSSSPSVAGAGTTTLRGAVGSTNAASGSTPSETELQQNTLKYSRCMRANGVPNFPDPNAGGGFAFQAGSGVDPSSPAFQAAQAKCRTLLPAGPAPGSQTHPSTQWLSQMEKAAQCMRRHGVPDFPDPRTSIPARLPTNGLVSDIDGAVFVLPSTIDERSPAFVRAAAACKFPLHNH